MTNHPSSRNHSPGLSLGVLTDDEINDIHQATLEILEKTGVFVEADEALAVFDGAGAEIDRKNKIVKIQPQLVEDAIQSAPSKILLAARDSKHDKVLEAGRIYFTNFSEGIEVIDPFSGQRRAPLKADLASAARLVDYLDEIDVCEKAVGSGDVPRAVLPLHNAEAMLTHTTKHCCVGPGSGYLLKKLVQMAGITALKEAQGDVSRMKDIYNERRRFMIDRLKEIGFGITVEPTGAFYVFANAKHLAEDSYKLAFDILENARVGVAPGIDFGPNGEGYLRFSYANSLENIAEGMDRLQNYLEGRAG